MCAVSTAGAFAPRTGNSRVGILKAALGTKDSRASTLAVNAGPLSTNGRETDELSIESIQGSSDQVSWQYDSVTSLALCGLATVLLLPTQEAFAAASDYGIFAGRSASMLHPITMFLLFGTTLYSGFLGLQWRRLRGLSDEIKVLQQQAPRLSSGLATFPLSAAVKAIDEKLKSAEPAEQATLTQDLAKLKTSTAAELDAKIEELKATRSSLQKADLKTKHESTGSVLLSVGVTVSLLGAFNTYMRAGKLFPGPHLYAGMGCTALWAVAAALVPSMSKGNEAARAAHIGLNTVNVALFAWQVVSGVDIMVKVWEKTSWP